MGRVDSSSHNLSFAAISVYVVYEKVYQHADEQTKCASIQFIPRSRYGRSQPQIHVSAETMLK